VLVEAFFVLMATGLADPLPADCYLLNEHLPYLVIMIEITSSYVTVIIIVVLTVQFLFTMSIPAPVIRAIFLDPFLAYFDLEK